MSNRAALRTRDWCGRFRLIAGVLAAASLAMSGFGCGSRDAQPKGQDPAGRRELQQRIAELTLKEKALSAELALAKSGNPYLAIDFATHKIDLKVRGRSLRSVTFSEFKRTGGAPSTAEAWAIQEARPLQEPDRQQVIPGSGESTTATTATREPWGPARMPMDYDLICKGERALEIRALPSGQTGLRFTRWIVSGYRQARDWAREALGRRRSAYQETIEIWLPEDDARLLFWSLPRDFGILLLHTS